MTPRGQKNRPNTLKGPKAKAVTSIEKVAPDSGRLIEALRQIGYSLEQAVSDLVDNSISAGADKVLIRFLHDRNEIKALAVVDNGYGMGERDMTNAMRFGSDRRQEVESLGKFGMGLKLASFSHAENLTVASKKGKKSFARTWTLDGIRNDWSCDVLSSGQASDFTTTPWSPINADEFGTLVYWEKIDKLPVSSRGLRFTLRSLHRRLQLHLGLHFHRFLSSGKLQLFVDQQIVGESEHQIRAEIQALDPFGYKKSGAAGYPKKFTLKLDDVGSLSLEGHIWPPNSESEEYKLGGRAAARQGFYFYRNNRLIQAGGWNGLVQNESEPHSSLARVMVDLPVELDDFFSLNVQKSSVIVPPGFVEAVREAADRKGQTFENFRHAAENVYRQSDDRAVFQKKVIPGKGISAALKKSFLSERQLDSEGHREVSFAWDMLEEDEIFRLDIENSTVLLNKYYRYDMPSIADGGRNDQPLFKMMLFHLLEQDLGKPNVSPKRKKDLKVLNAMLIKALLEDA